MSLTQLHPVYLEQALSICHLSSCGIVFRLIDIDASQKEGFDGNINGGEVDCIDRNA